MTPQEYEAKKRECWAAFKKHGECEGGSLMADAFFHVFDRAYALGMQDGSTQSTESKSMQLSDVKAKIDKWMNSHTEEEVYELLKRHGVIEGAEDTVLRGWVAMDDDGWVEFHKTMPKSHLSEFCDTGDYITIWKSKGESFSLGRMPIPNLTVDNSPMEVEITIKPKKKSSTK